MTDMIKLGPTGTSRATPAGGAPSGGRPSGGPPSGIRLSGGRLSELRRRVSTGDGAPLTASELAHLCHVETRIVHGWATNGVIPSFRTPGHHLRFQLADVAKFLKRQGPAGVCAETLVLCEPARRRVLRRRLGRADVEWFTEPLTLLVAAGKSQPNRVVIDGSVLGALEPSALIGVLTKALPQLEIVWLGELPRSCGNFTQVVRVADLRF